MPEDSIPTLLESLLRPPKRKYDYTWEPKILLDYLEELGPNTNLSLKVLSRKTAALLALTTAHRLQTLALISVENIMENEIQILITDKIKTTAVRREQPCLHIPFFKEKPNLCVASVLMHYVERSSKLRNENQEFLFLTTKKPHKTASTDTLTRWIEEALTHAGINTKVFSAYSTRHAATSAAYRKGVLLDAIKKTSGWSEKSQVFARFYNQRLKNTLQLAKAVFK
ncbi:hypothetical protein NQ317_002378 [Molorchus minor]|uniref:Tyr recombinase domain-containing protein n=1 Tax=Molorchus minor TaxID=1323400 RepID=A0ABQ9IZP3_9CUCU|nr:hypothetical protein NQ317_002378 [Molorchus minor]